MLGHPGTLHLRLSSVPPFGARLLLRSAIGLRPIQHSEFLALGLSSARLLWGHRQNLSIFVDLYSSVVGVVVFIIIVVVTGQFFIFIPFCFLPSQGGFRDLPRLLYTIITFRCVLSYYISLLDQLY